MRASAKSTGKKVPSADDVDKMFAELNNMQCPVCKRTMVLHVSLGTRSTVASLQHDNDGHMRIICSGCNSAHSKIGDIIYDIPDNHKQCSICKSIKTIDNFSTNNQRPDGRDCRCKHCRSKLNKAYISRKKKEDPTFITRCRAIQQISRDRIKNDPEKYEKLKQKNRERNLKTLKEIRKDPEKYEHYLRKAKEANRRFLEKLKANPSKYKDYMDRVRESNRRSRKRRSEKSVFRITA